MRTGDVLVHELALELCELGVYLSLAALGEGLLGAVGELPGCIVVNGKDNVSALRN